MHGGVRVNAAELPLTPYLMALGHSKISLVQCKSMIKHKEVMVDMLVVEKRPVEFPPLVQTMCNVVTWQSSLHQLCIGSEDAAVLLPSHRLTLIKIRSAR